MTERHYRLGDHLVPESGMKRWHNDRGLPWGQTFDGPCPVTMTRMSREPMRNIRVHLANEHNDPVRGRPHELLHQAHMEDHLYGKFREGHEHYHEEPS